MGKMDDIVKRIEEIKTGSHKGKITLIEEGKIADWIPRDKVQGKKERADDDAIRITVETPDGGSTNKILRLTGHVRGNFYKFLHKYRGKPTKGMAVDLTLDESTGFWDVLLE